MRTSRALDQCLSGAIAAPVGGDVEQGHLGVVRDRSEKSEVAVLQTLGEQVVVASNDEGAGTRAWQSIEERSETPTALAREKDQPHGRLQPEGGIENGGIPPNSHPLSLPPA
jgi:hypothetical protein